MDKDRYAKLGSLFFFCTGLVLMVGCTASDRDYVRQHIAENEASVVRDMTLSHGVGTVPVKAAKNKGDI